MSIDKFYPVLDLLEDKLSEGYYIQYQTAYWHLFDPKGNSHCQGSSIREMLVNLIFTDC